MSNFVNICNTHVTLKQREHKKPQHEQIQCFIRVMGIGASRWFHVSLPPHAQSNQMRLLMCQ